MPPPTPSDPLLRTEPAPAPRAENFASAAVRQRDLVSELDVLRTEIGSFEARCGWCDRGYFDVVENDTIEGFLLRLTALHSALWGEAQRWGGLELPLARPDEHPHAHVLVFHAAWAMADSASFVVDRFADDKVAIAKLNEAFYRSEIDAGTYDRLALHFTSEKRDRRMAAAWTLHADALADADSALTQLRGSSATAAELLDATAALQARASEQIGRVRARAPGGKLYEDLRHDRVAELARSAHKELGRAEYAARALVFKDVSRIKSPRAHVVRFSASDKQTIHSTLEPGDVLLTYTAGYISDVFIPGIFKHAITYVGGIDG